MSKHTTDITTTDGGRTTVVQADTAVIGAIGDGASANIAAAGKDARGSMTVNTKR